MRCSYKQCVHVLDRSNIHPIIARQPKRFHISCGQQLNIIFDSFINCVASCTLPLLLLLCIVLKVHNFCICLIILLLLLFVLFLLLYHYIFHDIHLKVSSSFASKEAGNFYLSLPPSICLRLSLSHYLYNLVIILTKKSINNTQYQPYLSFWSKRL